MLIALARDCFCEPLGQCCSNFHIVFLDHHGVPISMDANLGQFDPCGMESSLLEKLHRAMVVSCVVGGLGGHDQNWNLLKIGKLSRRAFLKPASAMLWRVRPVLFHDLQVRRILCWRRISERVGVDPPRPRKCCSVSEPFRCTNELDVVKRWAARLYRYYCLHQVRSSISDRPTECS